MAIKKVCYATLSVWLMLFLPAKNTSAQTPAKTIPDFEFFGMSGAAFTQAQLQKNSKILFLFFDATCPHCQYEVQQIGLHYKDFKNTAFYLVSMDQKQQISNFMNSYGKNLQGKKNVTVLVDEHREFIPKFMPSQYPALFIYNANHQLLKFWDTPANVDQVLSVIYNS